MPPARSLIGPSARPAAAEAPLEQRPLLQSGSAGHEGRGSAQLERGPPDLRAPADGSGFLKSQAAPKAPEVKIQLSAGASGSERHEEVIGFGITPRGFFWFFFFPVLHTQALLGAPLGPVSRVCVKRDDRLRDGSGRGTE